MSIQHLRWCKPLACALLLLPLAEAVAADGFRAGAFAADISPKSYPRIIAGGFLEGRGERLTSPLHSRAIVLDDGRTKLAFAIVDTCMMEQRLIDEAKALASQQCGIPVDHMMVSATHTHSAPAAMGCLGTRQDKDYAKLLVPKIAESIGEAHKRLQPARIGWGAIDDWEHTHNRRWIRLEGREVVDPFGEATGRANMHPGYLSKDVVGPSGPVDPQLSVISIQTKDGRPLAVLANYSQHYFGQSPVSADYFGLFCKLLAAKMNQSGDGNNPFVCAISQGTSGDLMWMDYGAQKKSLSIEQYADGVASYAHKALQGIRHHEHAPLGMVEKTLELNYRVPDEKRLAWARPIAAKIVNDVPRDRTEVYAREAVILHQRQQTTLQLQAIRIGDLSIATLPNEVYAITGLKLKARSPMASHFNIELANGAEGYIPPPEQHALGGYTTWPARTAGLEVQAEPRIVDSLLEGLEEVTGRKRRVMRSHHGVYAETVLAAKPIAYWRLDEADGRVASNAVPGGAPATVIDGAAWFLPGVGSGTGYGPGEALKPSAFSGDLQLNRALHIAGGRIEAPLPALGDMGSIALWFWLGHESGASERSGSLVDGLGGRLEARQSPGHRVRLALGDAVSREELRADDWHFVVVTRDDGRLRVHVDGATTALIEAPAGRPGAELILGRGLEGKLDEIAVFDRALAPKEITQFWRASGIAEQRAREMAERERAEQEAAQRSKPPQFAATYDDAIRGMKPLMHERLDSAGGKLKAEGSVAMSSGAFASFDGGRLRGEAKLGGQWSVSLWFRNDTSNHVRPVAAYLFSRGPDGDREAPGDHLGIGGNYKAGFAGRILFYNGNALAESLVGATPIPEGTWNHVVLVREGERVRVWLNGEAKPEIDAMAKIAVPDVTRIFLGARCDLFAPLAGHVAHFALFDRALSSDEAQRLHAASGQPKGTAKVVAPPPKPRLASSPLPPAEALRKIHIREGFKVELVAAEPVVLDPVAFDWDTEGRLWVVEMADYPLGMDGNGKPGGRVVRLEDSDADGRYDRREVIADGLSFPNGILSWRDGALVTAAPDILFINPGGVRKVLFSGFSEGNQQLRVNGLRWGMDGWVYCAAGGHHGNYNKDIRIDSKLAGTKIELGARDFRFKPDTGEFDPQSGPSQFGRARDDWGHWFGVQNSKPLWHYVLQDHYLRRNPDVIPPDPVRLLYPLNPPVYPASAPEKRYHSFNQAGRYTSACGINIYRGGTMFDDGRTHAFTCEPFHNLVQHHLLEDDGVSFKARTDTDGKVPDFFASEDRWCRPVMVRDGPDGALYVADMYRYMIEHPQFLPQEGREELLPHYRAGDDKGRIYRVVRADLKPRSPTQVIGAMFGAPEKGLRAAMESANGWVRDKAQMRVLWERPAHAEGPLLAVAIENPLPQARAQAAWTLQLLGRMTPKICERVLIDPSARVREQGLILAEKNDSREVIAAAARLAGDADAKVRLQLACTLGEMKGEVAGRGMTALLGREAEDPMIRAAALTSLAPHLALLARSGGDTAFDGVLATAMARGDKEALGTLLGRLASHAGGELGRFRRFHSLLGTLQRRNSSLEKLRAEMTEYPPALGELFDAAERVRQSRECSLAEKLMLLEIPLLDPAHREGGVRRLQALLDSTDAGDQEAAIKLLARHAPGESQGLLLAKWQGATPLQRGMLLDALMSAQGSTLALLDQVKAGAIPVQAFDAQRQAQLINHPSPRIKAFAAAVFKTAATSKRGDVLARFRPALGLKGSASNGRAVFAQACASCHKLDGVGLELGPDLRSVVQHEPEKLLNSILDPSAVIEPGFMAYHCTLKSGEQLFGIVATETSSSITMKLPGNVVRPILRSDIATLKSLNMSLMPDGLEAALTPQSLADVIAYLKTPPPK